MAFPIGSIPRTPALGLLAATAVSGAALAALTPGIMPRSKSDRKFLAIAGGAMGAAAGGALLGVMRLGKSPLGRAYEPLRTALTAATIIGAGAILATHWAPGTVEPPATPKYKAAAGSQSYTTAQQQQEAAPAGTSAVGRDKMDARGLRFLDTIVPDLKEQPVRVYSGLENASTTADKVKFALDRMHETGAFDKSRIIIAQPSGSGFVDQVPVQDAEILSGGDVATVAMQYGNSRSLSLDSMTNRGRAAEQYRALVEGVHNEIAKMPADKQPKVYLYGESLGGWTAQDAITKDGDTSFDQLGITRALWVGTPGPSKWADRVPADESVRVTGLDNLNKVTDSTMTDKVRVLEYKNTNDSVTKVDPAELWSRPDWLMGDKAIAPNSIWIPGITMLQTVFDTKNAIAASQPGVFQATAHDYRLAHAKAAQLAFGFPDATPAQLQAMTDQTEQLEQQYFATHPDA